MTMVAMMVMVVIMIMMIQKTSSQEMFMDISTE